MKLSPEFLMPLFVGIIIGNIPPLKEKADVQSRVLARSIPSHPCTNRCKGLNRWILLGNNHAFVILGDAAIKHLTEALRVRRSVSRLKQMVNVYCDDTGASTLPNLVRCLTETPCDLSTTPDALRCNAKLLIHRMCDQIGLAEGDIHPT